LNKDKSKKKKTFCIRNLDEFILKYKNTDLTIKKKLSLLSLVILKRSRISDKVNVMQILALLLRAVA